MNILDSYAGIDLEPNGGWNRVESLQTISEKEVEDLRKKSGLPAAAKPRGISLFFYVFKRWSAKVKGWRGVDGPIHFCKPGRHGQPWWGWMRAVEHQDPYLRVFDSYSWQLRCGYMQGDCLFRKKKGWLWFAALIRQSRWCWPTRPAVNLVTVPVSPIALCTLQWICSIRFLPSFTVSASAVANS